MNGTISIVTLLTISHCSTHAAFGIIPIAVNDFTFFLQNSMKSSGLVWSRGLTAASAKR